MPPYYSSEKEPLVWRSSTVSESYADDIAELVCRFPDASQQPSIIKALATLLYEHKTPTHLELIAILDEHLEPTIQQVEVLAKYRHNPDLLYWPDEFQKRFEKVTDAIATVTGQDAETIASALADDPHTTPEPDNAPACALHLLRRMEESTCVPVTIRNPYFEDIMQRQRKYFKDLGPALINLLAHHQVRYLSKLCEIYTGLGGKSFDFDGIVAGHYTSLWARMRLAVDRAFE